MRLRDSYDVPQEIVDREHSPAFHAFLRYWFDETDAIGFIDVSFLQEIVGEELVVAKSLIRRNLKLKYYHIITAAGAFGDPEAVTELRRMLAEERDVSWRLSIAGALWSIERDPVFLMCLEASKHAGGDYISGVHLYQVLWLDDERAVDFLIDLLDHRDSFVRFQVLGLLNTLELGRNVVGREEMVYHEWDYRKRRLDHDFRKMMTQAIRDYNRAHKGNFCFGFHE